MSDICFFDFILWASKWYGKLQNVQLQYQHRPLGLVMVAVERLYLQGC